MTVSVISTPVTYIYLNGINDKKTQSYLQL